MNVMDSAIEEDMIAKERYENSEQIIYKVI